jgi:hypothetical protein
MPETMPSSTASPRLGAASGEALFTRAHNCFQARRCASRQPKLRA